MDETRGTGEAVDYYSRYVEAYAAGVERREAGGIEGDPFGILGPLLEQLGDVSGLVVLDAGCGEGYLSRVLAARGATVTGIDLAERLVERARERTPDGAIEYRVGNLSETDLWAGDTGRFDAAASYLVLNDVVDYKGFIATLGRCLKPRGRLVLALNNPYGAVIRGHVVDYFDSGVMSPYRGMWAEGVKVYHHHRTMEEYLDAFFAAGLQLTKLADLSSLATRSGPGNYLPEGGRFPRFMLLAFQKEQRAEVDG